jgi:hypothetical protein
VALQAADHVDLVEVVADEAEAPLGMEVLAVVGDDAGRFLSAMLQGVEAERGQRRGVWMAENAEHAAFLMQAVLFQPFQALSVSLESIGHARPRLP